MQIKLNQNNLFHEVADACQQTKALDRYCSGPEKNRNRIEERTTEIFSVSDYLDKSRDWDKYITCVAKVTRRTERLELKNKQWKPSVEVSYYALTHFSNAKTAAKFIRGHWGIENSNHHVRDVTMQEDNSRIRKNPGIFARLRSFSLNILRANNVKNIRGTIYENSLNFENVINYKGILN